MPIGPEGARWNSRPAHEKRVPEVLRRSAFVEHLLDIASDVASVVAAVVAVAAWIAAAAASRKKDKD